MPRSYCAHRGLRPGPQQLPAQQRRARRRNRAVQRHALARHHKHQLRLAGRAVGPAAHQTNLNPQPLICKSLCERGAAPRARPQPQTPAPAGRPRCRACGTPDDMLAPPRELLSFMQCTGKLLVLQPSVTLALQRHALARYHQHWFRLAGRADRSPAHQTGLNPKPYT